MTSGPITWVPEPLQQDEAGRLWRGNLPDDGPITMVEVVNATAEPDRALRTQRTKPG